MPIYVFETECGQQVEKMFPVSDAPRIGDIIDIDGNKCRRVASFMLDGAGIQRKTHQYPFVSNSLPKNLRVDGEKVATDNRGRPIIRSQQHERNILRSIGWERD